MYPLPNWETNYPQFKWKVGIDLVFFTKNDGGIGFYAVVSRQMVKNFATY